MATQPMRPVPTPSSSSSHRHHPYAPTSASAAASSSKHQPNNHKWTSINPPPPRSTSAERHQRPPSPPRSRRDHSESPPAGLQAAFGGREGGKWWDEEIPAPPASLTSILDSFRRSGEGDRDLLLAILGAKKAEEDRLTALIQTRLTILQARLNVHAAANVPSVSLPTPSETVYSPRPPTEILTYMPERTPSLTSRGSASSSAGPVSPAEQQSNHLYPSYDVREKRPSAPESLYLPPPTNLWRKHEGAPATQVKGEYVSKARSNGRASPVSPRSENGLDMLLDAGRRVETRAE